MAERAQKYYKASKKHRDHEIQLESIRFLTEILKNDPEAKYYFGAMGGYGLATLGMVASSAFEPDGKKIYLSTGEEWPGYEKATPAQRGQYLKDTAPSADIDKKVTEFLGGGGTASLNFAVLSGMTFGTFCMIILILKNLDGVGKIVSGAAEVVPF